MREFFDPAGTLIAVNLLNLVTAEYTPSCMAKHLDGPVFLRRFPSGDGTAGQ